MTTQPKPSVHSAAFSIAELRQSIQNDEALGLSLKNIDIVYVDEGGASDKKLWTISYYDWGDTDFATLSIEEDTSTGKPSPAEMKLVCRGRAMVSGKQTPVVVFRKA